MAGAAMGDGVASWHAVAACLVQRACGMRGHGAAGVGACRCQARRRLSKPAPRSALGRQNRKSMRGNADAYAWHGLRRPSEGVVLTTQLSGHVMGHTHAQGLVCKGARQSRDGPLRCYGRTAVLPSPSTPPSHAED